MAGSEIEIDSKHEQQHPVAHHEEPRWLGDSLYTLPPAPSRPEGSNRCLTAGPHEPLHLDWCAPHVLDFTDHNYNPSRQPSGVTLFQFRF